MRIRSAVRAVVVSTLALVTIPALVSGVAQAAVCSVTDVQTSGTFTDLQAAINAANPGDTLDVTGHCTGNFTITKDLTLEGDGATLLDGNQTGTTVTVSFGNVTLSDLTVTGGTVNGFGGGISNGLGAMTLQDTTVSGNTANGPASGGGILSIGTLILQDSTVSGNTADGGNSSAFGGGIFNGGGTVTLQNTTVSGNTATADIAFGGGIFNNAGTLTLQDSTVSGNAATGNGGSASGGGIVNGGGSASVAATIVSGNTVSGTTTTGPDCGGAALTSGGYNVIGDTSNCSGFVGTDLQNVDPLLGDLQDNGGPTQTMGLLPGSPAINGVPLSGGACAVGGQTNDERGAPRPIGKGCEIGAVEEGHSTTKVVSSPPVTPSGQPVTFTATVCPNPSSLPAMDSGTVTFFDRTNPLTTVSLVAGPNPGCAHADLMESNLAPGRHNIMARYNGDGGTFKSRRSVIQRITA